MNYKRIHDQIIERAKNRVLEGYSEKHHIMPKCIGGGNEKDNIVKLTAREHLLIHLLLVRIYPNEPSIIRAAYMMCHVKCKNHKRNYTVGSREYATLRESYSKVVSNQFKGKTKKFSEEHKTALSLAAYNRIPKTEEQKRMQSNTMKEKYNSVEGSMIKAKISTSMTGKSKSKTHNRNVGVANANRKYVYNPITLQVRKVKGELLTSLLTDGWVLGRKFNAYE